MYLYVFINIIVALIGICAALYLLFRLYAWRQGDAEWLLDYTASEDYEDLAERYAYQGVAWSVTDEQRALQVSGANFEVAAG